MQAEEWLENYNVFKTEDLGCRWQFVIFSQINIASNFDDYFGVFHSAVYYQIMVFTIFMVSQKIFEIF